MRAVIVKVAVVVILCGFVGSVSASVRAVIDQAKRAVQSGEYDINSDLAPLIAALKNSSEEDKRALLSAIDDLGRGEGNSPAAVKRYLLEQATPLLLEFGRSAKDVFLRGDSLLVLRNMGASKRVLEEAAAIAEADSHSYIQSRGEILRNFILSMPDEATVDSITPTDPEKERAAIAYLKERKMRVGPDQLADAAMDGDAAAVQALLDAGVDPNSSTGRDHPLTFAVFSGCGAVQGETEGLIETVRILLAAGADFVNLDGNNNTDLIRAAQMCGPRIIEQLIGAGADIHVRNGSGISALVMAFIMNKLDSAEILIDSGAELEPREVQMVSGTTDVRARKLIARAARSQ